MMMQIICSKCSRTLDYSGDRPSFCSFCGNPLGDSKSSAKAHDPDAPTVAPSTISVAAAPREAAPAALGGYRIGRELGAGGMGAVYEAEESDSGRRVALKLIGAMFVGSPDAVERFRQEGRIASMLTHPRCVFVIKTDEEAGRPYIIMELMEGSSLKDLVERQGPMPPDEAIAKILDVIEGLQAAHRLEIIHRDVKPSNCFLENDGRVKVGDFGLAKSLVKESHLTKTGAFVGTPHFASPEQVRGETIDQQTDVYSVAATLFFLLTGRPPFWGSDPTATLARIVADPVPSVRDLKPEVPAALDRVVRRGLDRDRSRRYTDLEAFKQALLSLTPRRADALSLSRRAAAFVVDLIAIKIFTALVVLTVALVSAVAVSTAQLARIELGPRSLGPFLFVGAGVIVASFLGYFWLLESIAGRTLGKAIFGLRVCQPHWVDPPSGAAVALRTLAFYFFWDFGSWVALLFYWWLPNFTQWDASLLSWGWLACGVAVMASTMRARNNYRGVHELVSGTRVTHVASPTPRQALSGSGGWLLSFLGNRRLKAGMPKNTSLPEHVAGFAIRGALKWTERDKVLLGEDATLGRRVFIWLRAATAPPLDATRRDIGRRTRLRWLASGRQGEWQWDAILAPSGCPLPEFIHSEGVLEWSEARALLEDLASELRAACADKTLPQVLSPALVWVQPDGRGQLADLALTQDSDDSQVAGGADETRALTLLRQAAVLALDGRVLRPQETPGPIHAALPAAAKTIIDRLLQGVFTAVDQVHAALKQLSASDHAH